MSAVVAKTPSNAAAGFAMSRPAALPLIVDLDDFLLCADLDIERVIAELEASVRRMGRAVRPAREPDADRPDPASVALYARQGVDVSQVPLQQSLVDYISMCAEAGRQVHLIGSVDQQIVEALAKRIGGIVGACGAVPGQPLGAADKAAQVQRRWPGGFVYAGRDAALLQAATAVVMAKGEPNGHRVKAAGGTVEAEIDIPSPGLATWIKALRCHQWSKNALLLVPLLLGHAYTDPVAVISCLAGLLLVSVLASGTYLVNDILDLDADRRHASKRNRPLARGDIKVRTAIGVAATGIVCSLGAALALSPLFFVMLAGYLVTTLAYSLFLKRMMLVDVFVLAVLFTSRVAMGIALAGVTASPWLLTFTMFFFLSLSLAKRHVEVVNAHQAGVMRIAGRDYQASDLPLTVALGVGCNAVAMLVMFLYLTNDAMPAGYYAQPYWLWVAAFVVFLWSLRIWGLSHRGQLNADPVAFAIRDKVSLSLGAVVAVVFGLAI